MSNTSKTKTESPETPAARATRNGKIARLPHQIREELNRRLLDSEPGASLVQWLNGLAEVKDVLNRLFGGRSITEQNLSEWKQGGHRDWLAKNEAAEWLADTLADAPASRENAGGRRNRSRGTPMEMECVADRVAGWFFPHYVAAARRRLAAAQTPDEQWSLLRDICADLATLRRNEHYVERLRIWREKLRGETQQKSEITEKEFLVWARAQKDLDRKIWPDRDWMSPEEKEERMLEILGLEPRRQTPESTATLPGSKGEGEAQAAKSGQII